MRRVEKLFPVVKTELVSEYLKKFVNRTEELRYYEYDRLTIGDYTRTIYRFENNWGASYVTSPDSLEGGPRNEVAILRKTKKGWGMVEKHKLLKGYGVASFNSKQDALKFIVQVKDL